MSNYYQQGLGVAAQQATLTQYQPTLRERYESQLKDAEKRVMELMKELLQWLDRDPGLQRALELMGRY